MAHRWSRRDKKMELERAASVAYGYLNTEFGYGAPVKMDDPQGDFGLRYEKLPVNVEILCSERGRQVHTTLVRELNSGRGVALLLEDAFVALGLGPAQRVLVSGRTSHEIRRSIGSQSVALRAVLSALREHPDVDEFFIKVGMSLPEQPN